MNAGKLKFNVSVQTRSTGVDSEYGGQVTTWTTTVASLWVNIEFLTGSELLAAQAVNNKVNVRITARYRTGITEAMRIVHGSDIYDIHAVSPVPDKFYGMAMLCTTGVTTG
ncbi:MAG: phage head closure protein [Proteobacteria bacterium]|nr:phage head closure protein [Pseudomonadota bacterium]